VDISYKTRKEVGALGEKVAAEYLKRHGFTIRDRNFVRKTGELDIIAEKLDGASKENTLHFVEVKTVLVYNFLSETSSSDDYDPSLNLHGAKVRKVARTGEWYVLEKKGQASGMSLRKKGRGSGRWMDASCGSAAETAWRESATCHRLV